MTETMILILSLVFIILAGYLAMAAPLPKLR